MTHSPESRRRLCCYYLLAAALFGLIGPLLQPHPAAPVVATSHR